MNKNNTTPVINNIEDFIRWKEAQGRPNVLRSHSRLGMFRDKGDPGANFYESQLKPRGYYYDGENLRQEMLDYNREHDINAILQRMEEDFIGKTLLMELLQTPHANIDRLILESENKPKAGEWDMFKGKSSGDLISTYLKQIGY
tara:strand:- start:740 stop:1171 length:432 start_codon:yes stop_codon:yes gene_type:complete